MSDRDPFANAPLQVRRLIRILAATFVILFALVLASAITGPVTGFAVTLGLVTEGSSWWQVVRTVVQFGGFFLGVIAYVAVTGERDVLTVHRPSMRHVGLVVGVAAILLALQYGALYAMSAFDVTTGQNTATVPAGDPVTYYLAMIVVSLLIVGPIEELLFRGAVQGGLRQAFDAVPAILIASLLFGLVHLPAISGTGLERGAYVAVVFVLGCLLGYLYERTDNVLVPGLAHGLYNAAIYTILLAGVL